VRFEVLPGDVVSLRECFLAFKRIVVPPSSGPSPLGLLEYGHTAENCEITEKETAF
jgi:hypothetical protein